ncbi:hypothetical protein CANCADRAFT_1237 [Tortispora caseinolytica NRRL Y-17796]|uniref:Major facilitator superfamily (MFS) profile domain-containing protein n=1 Tax=Tortispora caseinolytica NRRL Y-17796 TaxID=767744 RepID=A0A1E4TLK5_9ASCO|nr:hypothetical protein CANCADRAFT_1237 [Tortispora caseinolytica NRRL Y-17796]
MTEPLSRTQSLVHSLRQLHSQLSESDIASIDELGAELAGDNLTHTKSEAPGDNEKKIYNAPDGGLWSWLQVLSAFLACSSSWGQVNTFGVFQAYYSSTLLAGKVTDSQISWIGTIQSSLVCLVGMFTGGLFDKGYRYSQAVIGQFFMLLGLAMTSLSTEYYQFILAQGVCMGLGAGLAFFAALGCIQAHFSNRRMIATGIAATGSSFGAIIFPIMLHRLIPQIGFGWSVRCLLLIEVVFAAVSLLVFRIPKEFDAIERHPRPIVDISIFKSIPYTWAVCGWFIIFVGGYIPLFYIEVYCNTIPGFQGNDLAQYMVSITAAGSILGRIIPNYLADKFGGLNMMIPGALMASILCFAWIGIKNVAGMIVFGILYGYASGSLVSLAGTSVLRLVDDISRVGVALGMNLFFCGIGALIGSPIGGAIYSNTGSFLGLQLFAAACLLCGVGCMMTAKLIYHRKLMHVV